MVDYTSRFLAQNESFGWSLDFSPNFLCELAYEGFVVTSTEMPFDNGKLIQVLLPWSDVFRSTLDVLDTHISKQVRKRAKRFTMSVDKAFDDVMLGCIHEHGEAWLYSGMRWMMRSLFRAGYTGLKK